MPAVAGYGFQVVSWRVGAVGGAGRGGAGRGGGGGGGRGGGGPVAGCLGAMGRGGWREVYRTFCVSVLPCVDLSVSFSAHPRVPPVRTSGPSASWPTSCSWAVLPPPAPPPAPAPPAAVAGARPATPPLALLLVASEALATTAPAVAASAAREASVLPVPAAGAGTCLSPRLRLRRLRRLLRRRRRRRRLRSSRLGSLQHATWWQ